MFKVNNTGVNHNGELIYIKNENSFDFKPSRNADITLMIGYIYLGIDSETMLAEQIWGYSPMLGWREKRLHLPNYIVGELKLNEKIESGISKRLISIEELQVNYDQKSGWICIGNEYVVQNEVAVEFATNTIAVLNNKDNLKSIWLKPTLV